MAHKDDNQGPQRPRRVTADYSANYYTPSPGFDEEPDHPVLSFYCQKAGHVARNSYNIDVGDDEEPYLQPPKRASVVKTLVSNIDSAEANVPDDAEFADEWGQFLAPEPCELGVDDDTSDGEYEETTGENIDLEDNEEHYAGQDKDFVSAIAHRADTKPFLP